MKKYYYTTDGSSQKGPFTLEELKRENLSPDTYIWYEELGKEWIPASQLPGLFPKTASVPPAPPKASDTKPKTWLVESILVTLFCCLPLGILGIIFASQVESKHNAGDLTGAQLASKRAKNCVLISLISGVVIGLIYLGLFFSVFDEIVDQTLK